MKRCAEFIVDDSYHKKEGLLLREVKQLISATEDKCKMCVYCFGCHKAAFGPKLKKGGK